MHLHHQALSARSKMSTVPEAMNVQPTQYMFCCLTILK
jgi:hypothetical protein